MAYLEDGYQTLIGFTGAPSILLREKTVQPFGMDGGDRIEQTTMRNVTVHTYAPQHLIEATQMQFTASYDPGVLTTIISMININDLISVFHSDGTAWEFFGYLRSFVPNENQIGEQPTAACIIEPTNLSLLGAEQVPAYISP